MHNIPQVIRIPVFPTIHIGNEHTSISVTLPSYSATGWVISNTIVVVQTGGLGSNQTATLAFAPLCSGLFVRLCLTLLFFAFCFVKKKKIELFILTKPFMK